MRAKGRNEDSYPTAQEVKTLETALNWLSPHCERADLRRSLEHIGDIRLQLEHRETYTYVTLEKIHRLILGLEVALARDLEEQLLMYLPSVDAKYYEQEQLFGPEVFTNFPSTRNDVAEAGNCYATGRYTACVFHCMRVVERGLHALVHELNSKHNAGIVFRDKVEYENWGAIITEIQLALENPKRIKRLDPLPTKEEMTFYSKVAIESEYIKNAWRDNVAHSRSAYDQPSARSVLDHVEAFMKYLAKQGLTE